MKRPTLKAENRKTLGRKVKNLRAKGELPANIYGKKIKSQAVKVDLVDFKKVFREVGETGLVDLKIGKKQNPVLIHNIQSDPVTDMPLHADFFQVNLKEKVSAQVPLELAGEAPAEKEGLGTVVQYINEIEVEALPTDLPEKFEVDLAGLGKVDDAIFVKDLKIEKGKVDIKNEEEQIIVKVEPPREEEEEPAPVVTEEEGEESVEETDEQKGEDSEEKVENEKEEKDSKEETPQT